MWAPSTSASVISTTLWYRASLTSNSSRMPVPTAVISAWISLLERTLSIRAFSTLMILPRSGSTAWVLRSRPCLAEPPAESPSTMKSSARAGSRTVQSASLPGRVEFSSADLRRVRSRALRAAWRARAASTALPTIRFASPGFSSKNSPSLRLTVSLTRPSIGGLPSLVLVWPSNCGSCELDRDHRGQPLAHVVAGEVLVFLFEQAFAARVGVERPGQRRAEAGEVGAALVGVDVVGEAEDRFLVGGVPLHRDLDLAVVGLALEVDGLAVQRVLVLVEVGDEVDDPALVVEGVALAGAALVDQLDLQAAGEEGGLAQPLGQGRVVELELVEDLVVGQEGDRGAGRLGRARPCAGRPAACRARSPGSRRGRRG